MNEPTVLDIKWDVPGLPDLVGTFDSEAEAVKWAELNIPNGSWATRPLASETRALSYPYARSSRRTFGATR